MEISLKNQVALITGSSSGIGAGIAKSMAESGAKVVINYPSEHSRSKAEAVLKEITDSRGEGMICKCDVSKENEVVQMFQEVVSAYGTVDILVNNAGIQSDAKFTEMTLDQWNSVIAINLTGQFLCAREAIKVFFETRHRSFTIRCLRQNNSYIFRARNYSLVWSRQLCQQQRCNSDVDADFGSRIWRKQNSRQFYLSGRNTNQHQQRCLGYAATVGITLNAYSLRQNWSAQRYWKSCCFFGK